MSTPTVVLVPGACHGAWWYAPVVDALEAQGLAVDAVTLAGLCERADELDGTVTLSSHVAELTDRVRELDTDVVLVGHSYGSMVVAGVADALPERVRGLLSVDGFAPDDGESCWDGVDDAMRAWYVEGAARTGIAVDPMPQFDARATAHPLATLVQRLPLRGAEVRNRHYALAADPAWTPVSPFPAVAERLRADPAWTVHDLPTTHNVLRDGPEVLVDVVGKVVAAARSAGGQDGGP